MQNCSMQQSTKLNFGTKQTYRAMFLGMLCVCVCVIVSNKWIDAAETTNEPAEPVIAEASDEAENAIGTFKIPDGWNCEVFAAEPDVANPVALFIDNQNRVFVCESYRQDQGVTDNRKHDDQWLLADLQAKTVEDRIAYHKRLLGDAANAYTLQDDRIRMLVDRDNDGAVDESVVFASNFNQLEDGTGAGVLVNGDSAYYTCIPNLWKLDDTDGDGIADKREVLATGFGVRVAFRGHDMHGLIIGPDGRLYFSIGDRGYHVETQNGVLANSVSGAVFRCELDGSNLEVFADGLRNPQELAFDDYGRLFTGDNNSDSGDQARWVYIVQGSDAGWRMYYQYLADRGPFNREHIWEPYDPNTTPAYIVPPIANVSDGPSGLTCYPGTGFGEEYRNKFFLCDFRGQSSNSGIRMLETTPKGAFFELTTSEQPLWQILCTDADFGPDGALYVSDWVNGWVGQGKGRVYRFTHKEHAKSELVAETRKLLGESFTGKAVEEVADLMRHADRRVRLKAQWYIAGLELKVAIKAFLFLAADENIETWKRLHGVWGLGQIARNSDSYLGAEALRQLVGESDEHISANAIKALRESNRLTVDDLKPIFANSSPIVQSEIGYGIKSLEGAIGFEHLVTILAANNNADPILRHAAIEGLTGCSAEKIAKLTEHDNDAVRLAAVVALRRMESELVAGFLSDNNSQVVVEAARAVHDVPALHGQLPVLAELLNNKKFTSEAIVRRAINANFIDGSTDSAKRIASYAADKSRDGDLRMEAIGALADWTEGSQLDRVLNDYRPTDARSESDLRTAIIENLESYASQPDDVRGVVMQIVAKLKMSQADGLLRNIFKDKNAPGAQRGIAVAGLLELDTPDSKELLDAALDDSNLQVRKSAFEWMANNDAPNTAEMAVRFVNADDTSLRQIAWDTIGKLDDENSLDVLKEAVSKIESNDLPADVWLNVREAAEKRIEGAASLSFEIGLNGLDAADFTESIVGGDIERGKQLFFGRSQLSCVRCHRIGSKGGAVGPDLTEIAKDKDGAYLLESIVAPSAKIAKGYETVIVATEDGEVLSGILKSEDDEYLNLVTSDGAQLQIEQEIIIDRQPGLSSMPNDLMQYMSRRELRDLVAYLTALDGKHPEALPAEGVSGGHE